MENDKVIDTVKQTCGIQSDITDFDTDLCMYTNLSIDTMNQMGRECKKVNLDSTWGDVMDEYGNLSMVQTFICLNVKMLFDPPTNGTAAKAIEEKIKELGFRLCVKEET